MRDSRRAWPGQLGEAEGLWVLPVFSSCTPQKRVKGSRARPAHGKDGQAHGEVPPPAVVPQGPPAEHAFPPTGGSPPVLVTTSGVFFRADQKAARQGPPPQRQRRRLPGAEQRCEHPRASRGARGPALPCAGTRLPTSPGSPRFDVGLWLKGRGRESENSPIVT